MNLTKEFPRSPKEKMAGLVHIPRMTDKARAARGNTLGEYIYPCPLDEIMLEFLDVDSETFQHRACDDTEKTLAAWVAGQCRHRSQEEKVTVNGTLLNRQPDNPKKWESFYATRDQLNPSRKDVTTWVDLIDLEEGRT